MRSGSALSVDGLTPGTLSGFEATARIHAGQGRRPLRGRRDLPGRPLRLCPRHPLRRRRDPPGQHRQQLPGLRPAPQLHRRRHHPRPYIQRLPHGQRGHAAPDCHGRPHHRGNAALPRHAGRGRGRNVRRGRARGRQRHHGRAREEHPLRQRRHHPQRRGQHRRGRRIFRKRLLLLRLQLRRARHPRRAAGGHDRQLRRLQRGSDLHHRRRRPPR